MSNLVEINPSDVRTQSTPSSKSSSATSAFADTLAASNALAATTVGVATNSQRSAAVTNAAISGLAGGAATLATASSAPYYGGVSGGTLQVASNPLSGGGYQFGSTPYAGGADSVLGATGSSPVSDNAAVLQAMHDSQMEMLMLQAKVGNEATTVSLQSGLLKTKQEMEANIVRKTGAQG